MIVNDAKQMTPKQQALIWASDIRRLVHIRNKQRVVEGIKGQIKKGGEGRPIF